MNETVVVVVIAVEGETDNSDGKLFFCLTFDMYVAARYMWLWKWKYQEEEEDKNRSDKTERVMLMDRKEREKRRKKLDTEKKWKWWEVEVVQMVVVVAVVSIGSLFPGGEVIDTIYIWMGGWMERKERKWSNITGKKKR